MIAKLRAERERSLAIAALRDASKIEDPELLGRLVDLGLDARSGTALALGPVFEVAWADGTMEPKEGMPAPAAHDTGGQIAGYALPRASSPRAGAAVFLRGTTDGARGRFSAEETRRKGERGSSSGAPRSRSQRAGCSASRGTNLRTREKARDTGRSRRPFA